MFVQVIHGAVSDPAAIKAAGQRWYDELSAGADGWVGSTAGVTADGTFILFAQFDSAEAAQRNSDRSEQGDWWSQTESLFSGEVSFENYDDVISVGGDVAGAGFVQAMLGVTSDPGRQRELTQQFMGVSADFRPDILGGLVCLSDDSRFAQVFYFTSEVAAREGEQREAPEQIRQAFEEEQALTSEVRFLDLTDPWIFRPR